jgi:type IV pilus assembly protein PilF
MKFCVMALLIATLGCSTLGSKDKQRAQLHLQIGVGYLSQGNNPAALNELLKADQLDPSNAAIKNNLGLAYYVRGKLDIAEKYFRESLSINKKFSDAANNLGRLLIDQKKFKFALRELRKAEDDLTYEYPEKTLANLGLLYFELGDYTTAQSYLKKSLDLRRDSCVTRSLYGRTLLELKSYEESATALDKAIELCREIRYEEPLFFSAMSYYSLGDSEKSRVRLEELIRDHPQSKYFAKAKGMLELLQP